MNPWYGIAAFTMGFLAVGHIRDPYIKKNKAIKIVEDRKTKLEITLIVLVTIGGIVLPALWIIFDIFSFANYELMPMALACGIATDAAGLWLFKRAHEDLGTNWSVSLELKENHRLVTQGIYKYVRHPMYSALFVMTAAQIFLLSNWIVGPAGIVTFALMYVLRVRSEEKMMLEKFGLEYETYMRKSKRLVPCVW
jgi:protein-S-isoprenylcysteine O-methyltransferase Ste14